jgi:hypothetical protein|tara:strand:- start:4113 stop:4634 length:522 start_codon:yes stop_codon:yes gene_type:complete
MRGMRIKPLPDYNMRIIKNGAAREETLPLPCYPDDDGVLQYDSEFADDLIIAAYGENASKYVMDSNTLELFYQATKNTRYRVARIEYESFFTDIKGTEEEGDFLASWQDMDEEGDPETKPEDYEMYNLTLYHFNKPSIKSSFINSKSNKVKGMSSAEYFKAVIDKLKEKREEE